MPGSKEDHERRQVQGITFLRDVREDQSPHVTPCPIGRQGREIRSDVLPARLLSTLRFHGHPLNLIVSIKTSMSTFHGTDCPDVFYCN